MADPSPSPQNLKHFQNLAVIAYIDRKVEDNELRFLRQRQRQLGIGDAEAREVLSRVVSRKIDLIDPGSAAEREVLLADAAELALVEGCLHQTVFEGLLSLARKMGASEADMERAVQTRIDRFTAINEAGRSRVSRRVVHALIIAVVLGGLLAIDALFYGFKF